MPENTVAAKPATIKAVSEYFRAPGRTLSEFGAEWKALSDQDKADLRKGIGDGTLDY